MTFYGQKTLYYCCVELKYTIDQFAQEPILLIHGDIGYEEGTMGDQFVKELMYLDTLNKSRIQVWINSGGGVVLDGEMICNAILKSKTPVDTYNTGTCASIAYPIFACGRKRYMMDFAKNMFHNPFGGDEKSLKAFKDTILKIIIERSGGKLTEAKMSEIMNEETWIMAEESKKLGLCDEVEESGAFNKAEMIKNLDQTKTTWRDYSKVLNKMTEDKKPKIQNMDKVCNKLGLNSGSNEATILDAIHAMEVKNRYTTDELAKAKKELEECKNDFQKKEKDYIETKAKYDQMVSDSATAQNKAKEIEAKDEVAKAVKVGKIENKQEVIDKMVAKYIANPKDTKEILDSLKGTVESADTDELDGQKRKDGGLNVMDINNSIMEKYKKRQQA